MCKKNKLYEFAIDENTWNESEEKLRVEAKKIIREGDNVKKSKEDCFKRLLSICDYEEERLENNIDSGLGLHGIAVEELSNTIREMIGEIRYSWEIYEWITDVEKEKKNEDIVEMFIRVSIKKGLPIKSVNKIILSYHHESIEL